MYQLFRTPFLITVIMKMPFEGLLFLRLEISSITSIITAITHITFIEKILDIADWSNNRNTNCYFSPVSLFQKK